MKKLLATIVTAVCAAFGASAETIRLDDVQYNITVRDGDVYDGCSSYRSDIRFTLDGNLTLEEFVAVWYVVMYGW